MKMKAIHSLFLPILSVWVSAMQAQAPAHLLKEINEQVWASISRAYAELDPQPIEGILHEDLIRTSGPVFRTKQEHLASITAGFARCREKGETREFSIRFFERYCNSFAASERGIMRVVLNKGTPTEEVLYGEWHVILRKEDGLWRILTSYDTDKGATIGQAEYDAAFALEEVNAFR